MNTNTSMNTPMGMSTGISIRRVAAGFSLR